MSQDGVGVDLETSLGYLLKEASSALRAAMEAVLRPLGMTVTHYSCLELLAQRPGLSNSELARGAFVTRQSMNVLLQALERDGYVTRPAEAPVGKALPTRLTPRGRRSLAKATAAVRTVEVRMLSGLTDGRTVGRVQDPAEHDPLPARRRSGCGESAEAGSLTRAGLSGPRLIACSVQRRNLTRRLSPACRASRAADRGGRPHRHLVLRIRTVRGRIASR